MDVFTHFVLPYLLLWVMRRPHRERLAAGVGGYAPDLDVLTAVIAAFVDPLYYLGHRGVSHTLLGAPLHALALVLILRLPLWTRISPRAQALRFGWRLAVVAMLASYTHLALDATTMWGIPLLWPLSFARVSAGWYFYSVLWAVPIAAYFVWRLARGTATDRLLRRVGALVVVVILLSGAVRAATLPSEAGADVAQPNNFEWQWTTLARGEDAWSATFWSWRAVVGNATYPVKPPATPAEEDAVARARETYDYKRFALYAGGPEAVQVEARTSGGGWNVTFVDLMVRTQADRSGIEFPGERGLLELVVARDGSVRERG